MSVMAAPQLTISAAAAKRLRHFDVWVFRDELNGAAEAPHGAAVELCDPDGTFVAHAWYSAASHIAARVVSTDRGQPIDRTLLTARLTHAVAKRDGITETDARRLVSSEADGLPGLIVDQYGRHLVLQLRTAGCEAWRSEIVSALTRLLRPAGILERDDKEFREDEGLPPVTQILAGAVPDRLLITDDALRFWVDPHHGHKTGFYLDQRDTRRAFRRAVRAGERVADVFAYTGAFGLAAAAQGAQAVCVEQEEAHVALARLTAQENGLAGRVDHVTGNAFHWLEAKAGTRERFDWVLLDPPGLARVKADVPKARQALHHLVRHALTLLTERGTLLLSVCTYHLLPLAEEILRIAAGDVGMRLRMRAVTMQAGDHPWVLQLAMSRYLTTWWAQRDGGPAA